VSQIAETREKVMLSFMDFMERDVSSVTTASEGADALSDSQEPAQMTFHGWMRAGEAGMGG